MRAILLAVIGISLCNVVNADVVMRKIEWIESRGDVRAYVERTQARGLYQITPIVLKEWNGFHPNIRFSEEDLFNADVSLTIGAWYMNKRVPEMLKAYNIPDNETTRLACYNWGVGNVVKWWRAGGDPNELPRETREYIRQYKEMR